MAHDYQVRSAEQVYAGRIISVRRDIVAMPGGGSAQRDVVVHPGAVGVVALDEAGRVLLLRQYRHPVGRRLWELPAGLLDQPGEDLWAAARRELAEEAGLSGRDWHTLVDAFTSPGMSNEAIRVYLAQGIEEIRHDFARTDEEAEMTSAWVALDEAVRQVFVGEIVNALAVLGVLAAAQAAADGFTRLRAVDAPWSLQSAPPADR